ncbi:hypothetical protein GRS48_03095 [Halorubrum sp. JWXQ-INN 858]|uniref:hypothetical protein n=1 Tax=Halorubrum sp. JWXQ-INN 858 TaxID=2690782 RepID=UPI001357485A|nr:hypothetical protein [Halorubrum sp. JWXQ-INN 858]MWV63813.1 hypothetical protein [Halorubrum sp. JWXQ-INN 858]
MEREGPGFLADLAFLWVTIIACIVVADAIDRQIGRPGGLLLAIGAAAGVAFVGLLAYYRVFLDERPILGTRSRSRFAILWVQIVFFGFILGAVFAPPDATVQFGIAGMVMIAGLLVAYWYVYLNGSRSEKSPTEL